MAGIEFNEIATDAQKAELAEMASCIWNEYWPAIIGQEQTTYMIENFQSLSAFDRDMDENGYEYWFIASDDDGSKQVIGYTGGHNEIESGRFFISKIYLMPEARGRGLASQIISFYEQLCKSRSLDAMYLTVNKRNEPAIKAYKKNGFDIVDAVQTDIGSGFVMDDYIMEKQISADLD